MITGENRGFDKDPDGPKYVYELRSVDSTTGEKFTMLGFIAPADYTVDDYKREKIQDLEKEIERIKALQIEVVQIREADPDEIRIAEEIPGRKN